VNTLYLFWSGAVIILFLVNFVGNCKKGAKVIFAPMVEISIAGAINQMERLLCGIPNGL
jgi:hypothetical protein